MFYYLTHSGPGGSFITSRVYIVEMKAAPPGAPAGPLAYVSCALPPSSISRYGRQMVLPSFGSHSQTTLATLRVLLVGAGGLGCPIALYLAAAGVGERFLGRQQLSGPRS